MLKRYILFFVTITLIIAPTFVMAETVRNITGEGEAAVMGITAEEGQRMALQSARVNAIEEAAGVHLLSSTLVKNSSVIGDFIKSYSRGLIIREEVEWLPMESMRPTPSSPPIPVYRVAIKADVAIPEKKQQTLSLRSKLNQSVFRAGKLATLEIEVSEPAYIAIFNLMADDTISMLYPYDPETGKQVLQQGERFRFPQKGMELVMQTMSGHKRDTEAFWIVALPAKEKKSSTFIDMFRPGNQERNGTVYGRTYSFTQFNEIYRRVADSVVESILPYEVILEKGASLQ